MNLFILGRISGLFALIILIFTVDLHAQYCVPNYIGNWDDEFNIRNVTIASAGLNNSSLYNYPYGDYTSITGSPFTLEKMTNTMSITYFAGYHYYEIAGQPYQDPLYAVAMTVWIDFNQDFQFSDTTEKIITYQHITNWEYIGLLTFNQNFDIPATALNGPTRMRVRMDYYSPVAACDPGWIGQIEDYTVTITDQKGIWKGAVNNDWSNAGNWTYNQLPTDTTNVIIPSYTINNVEVFSTANAKNITIEQGKILTVRGVLNLYGDLYPHFANNEDNFWIISGNLNVTGNGEQTYFGGNFGTHYVNPPASIFINKPSGNFKLASNQLDPRFINLILNNGNVDLNGNTCRIQNSSNGSVNSYIITNGGYMRRQINRDSTRFFPVGTFTAFRPIYLTNTGNLSGFTVGVTDSVLSNVTSGTNFTNCLNTTWHINDISFNGAIIKMKIPFNASYYSGTVNTDNLFGYQYNSNTASWQNKGGTVTDIGGGNYQIEVQGINEFSSFSVLERQCNIVSSIGDSGYASLREAISCANNADTIYFGSALNNQTLTLNTDPIVLNKDLTFINSNSGQVTVSSIIPQVSSLQNVFQINAGKNVSFENFKIVGGYGLDGSAVLNHGNLTLKNMTMTNGNKSDVMSIIKNQSGSSLDVIGINSLKIE
jgi:hypothetical protein